jgi:predicted alpha/beta-fold hydrolase
LTTPDGDFLDLDWYQSAGNRAPLVVLLHGLSGSSRSGYIVGLQQALAVCGFRSVALNFRGCSGEYNRTAWCYHSGETSDFDHVYRTIRRREPQTPLAAVGFSLGGNMLLKWLGERREGAELFAAAAVSVPLVLNRCADRMDRGFSRLYRDQLLRELKAYIHGKRLHLASIGALGEAERLERLGDLRPIRSFWEYDERVVAPLYGFRDAFDYYRKSSSRQFLGAIRVPTLIVQAADDPFLTPDILPAPDELPAGVCVEVSPAGGHVGFVTGSWPGRARYWLEERIPAFLRQELSGSRSGKLRRSTDVL